MPLSNGRSPLSENPRCGREYCRMYLTGSFSSLLPVKYPLLWAGSLHVPFSVQCHAVIRSSVLLRYVIGPHPAESASCTICGVYTLSMPVFDSTSTELPSALSGSKELMG